jgi:hypothetical protein
VKSYRALIVVLSLVVMPIACDGGEEATPALQTPTSVLSPTTTPTLVPAPTRTGTPTPTSVPSPTASPTLVPTRAPTPTAITNRTTSGHVEEDETWRGQLLITGDVLVPPGVTLTIEPGTTIRFTAQSDDQHTKEELDPEDESTWPATMISILVSGVLDARGTGDQPIVFTSDSESPGELDWQSIMVEGSGTVRLDHVTLEHSFLGLELNAPSHQLSVRRTTFRDITTCAICGHGAPPNDEPLIISDNRFIRCGREAIDTYRGQRIVVRHNVFAENYVAIMSVGSSITVEGNLFINNIRGIGVVEGGTPEIIGNEFTRSSGAAIFVTDASPTVANNNLYDNVLNFQMEGGSQDAVATNNWWGSADPGAIAASILDGRDDPSLGIVEFEPYAREPFDLDVPEYQ